MDRKETTFGLGGDETHSIFAESLPEHFEHDPDPTKCQCYKIFEAFAANGCPIAGQLINDGEFDHDATIEYLRNTSESNESTGESASSGMSAIGRQLNRW